jgi:hypothetical protein
MKKTLLPLIALLVLSDAASAFAKVTNAPPGGILVNAVRAPAVPMKETTSEKVSQIESNSVAGKDLGAGESTIVKQEIRLENDSAIADYGLLKVYFPADITESPITIITPDGRKLQCRATFLALLDNATGKSVLLGQVRKSEGQLVGDNSVIYPNAFESINADIRLRYTKYSLEQDIILKDNPKIPAEFESGNVRLEVWSEWIDSQPDKKETQMIDLRPLEATGKQAAVASADEQLKFGATRIADGYAFTLGNEADKTPVAKQFIKIEGRDWLIERVDYTAIKANLEKLPKSQAILSPNRIQTDRTGLVKSLQAQAAPKETSKIRRMAMACPASKDSLVLDFVIFSSVPVPADVISWWPAGGNAEDAMSANNDGTAVHNTSYGSGKVGQSFIFHGYDWGLDDGSADYVEINNSASLNPTNGLTIETWIYYSTDFQGVNMPIVSKDGSSRQYLLTKFDNDTIRAHVGVTNGNFYYTDGQTVLQPDTWYHVAMTYSVAQSNLSIYVNGMLDTNVLVSGSLITSSESLYIGGAPPYYYYWAGGIDEPAIYSRALSASEIQSIYNAGPAGKINPNCASVPTNTVAWWAGDGNRYDLARTNHATLSGASYESGAVLQGFNYDGVDDGVTAANDNALNLSTTNDNITIETWINAQVNYNDYGVMSVAGKRYSPNSYTATGYELYLLNGAPGFQIANSSGIASYTATGDLRNGYHHVAVTMDRSLTNGGKIYVDGTAILTFNPTVISGSLSNAEPFRIGVHPTSALNCWYKGVIDETTVYRRALTGTEVTALYTAGGAGKCKVDFDADGLTDLQESFLGTNPNLADTDGDGLTDGDEVFVYKTNPLNQDSDGDGVNDGIEVLQGRNPKAAGTTADSGNQIKLNIFSPLK